MTSYGVHPVIITRHIAKLCNKSAGQLNALNRLNRYLGFEEKKILINSFIYDNFNYCPLVWQFFSKNSLNKIENIKKGALIFLLNDYESDYKTLLKKCHKCTMEVRRLRTLALENFKTLNNLNLFAKREVSKRSKNNLEIANRKTVIFGDKNIRSLGPYI